MGCIDSVTWCNDLRENRSIAGRGSATTAVPEHRRVIHGTNPIAGRIVGRTDTRTLTRAAVSSREHHCNTGNLEYLNIGLKLGNTVAGIHGKTPGVINDCGGIIGKWITIGVQQPLVAQMNITVLGIPRIVKHLHRDPLRPRGNANCS